LVEIEKDPKIFKKIYKIQQSFNNMNNDLRKLLEKDDLTERNEIKFIEQRCKEIRNTLTEVTDFFGAIAHQPQEKKALSALDVMSMFDVPDEMRKTLTSLIRLGPSEVEKISERTKRDIDLEKGYLMVLNNLGFIDKQVKEGKDIFRAVLGKKKSKISDHIWQALVKDTSEMMNYVCRMELEKAELKKLDFDEIKNRIPHVKDDVNLIKISLDNYISTLGEMVKKYELSEEI